MGETKLLTPQEISTTTTSKLPETTEEELVTTSTYAEIIISSEKTLTSTRYSTSQSTVSFDLSVFSSTPSILEEDINNDIVLNSIDTGDGLVDYMNEFSTEPIEELGVITGDAAVNEIEEVFYPPSEFDKNEAQNIIQDGSLFAESFNAGVVRAKVVEDTSYARSIIPANVGVAGIIAIVIGILATVCFAMRRRRRDATTELAPSSSAYTNTSRYTPDNSSSAMSDMKATYAEELSPNVSSSDIQRHEVVVPMDGHLTIVGSYEEFLDVPTGARPNILQSLPVSPTMHTETVTRTIEMTDPELAFMPSSRINN